MRLWIERHRARAELRRDIAHRRVLIRRVLVNHGEVSRFAVGAENQLGIRIEACCIGVLPDGHGRHYLTGVGIHDHHLLVAADGKQSPVLLIECQSGWLFAARERPAMKYRKLLRIDLKKLLMSQPDCGE